MNKMMFFALSLATLLALSPDIQAEPPNRDVSQLELRSDQRTLATLAAQLDAGNSLLIVLDARSGMSRQWVEKLRASGFEGERAVVLVLGATSSDLVVFQGLAKWPQAHWFGADAAVTLKALNMQGTPAVFGLTGTHLLWRQSGLPQHDADELLLRMLNWIARPVRQIEPTP